MLGAADQHRRRLDQHVEPAEGFGDALEHRLVLVDLAKVHADGEMRAAGQRIDHRLHRRLVEIDGGDPRPRFGEGRDHLAADAARGARHHDALALEPSPDRPRHAVLPITGAARAGALFP